MGYRLEVVVWKDWFMVQKFFGHWYLEDLFFCLISEEMQKRNLNRAETILQLKEEMQKRYPRLEFL